MPVLEMGSAAAATVDVGAVAIDCNKTKNYMNTGFCKKMDHSRILDDS